MGRPEGNGRGGLSWVAGILTGGRFDSAPSREENKKLSEI